MSRVVRSLVPSPCHSLRFFCVLFEQRLSGERHSRRSLSSTPSSWIALVRRVLSSENNSSHPRALLIDEDNERCIFLRSILGGRHSPSDRCYCCEPTSQAKLIKFVRRTTNVTWFHRSDLSCEWRARSPTTRPTSKKVAIESRTTRNKTNCTENNSTVLMGVRNTACLRRGE
jgi:hypothetical protein